MDPPLLQCIICPGQPRFSDTSHLLTHISSKAHLSHYFKLQVRSHQEDGAVELLIQYDEWFNTNNLAQLLSNRNTSKEDKRKKRKTTVQLTTADRRAPSRTYLRVDAVDPSPRAILPVSDCLDPRLVDDYGNVKQELDSQGPSVSCYYTQAGSAAADTDMVSSAALGTGSSQHVDTAKPDQWSEYVSYNTNGENPNAALPVTPEASRIRFRHNDMPWRMGSEASDAFIDAGGRTEPLEGTEADKERADEMARLKGVLWPGMDIFDSATQQMRRKRNQKKDGNVLKMMEKTSSQVEPTEFIFSPMGTLQKQRVISGNVDDDSPLKGETPIPKGRQPRSRMRTRRNALRQTDSNRPRAHDRKGTKNTTPKISHDVEDDWHENSPTPARPFARIASLKPSYTVEDDEFVLSTKAFGKRARKGFAVFADDDQDKQTFKDQRTISGPPRETLTPARLVLDSKSTTNDHGHKADHYTLDKENIEPILSSQGRIDLHSWNNSPFLKRWDSNDAVYSRYFFNEPTIPGLGQGVDHERHRYRSNPLLAPSAQTDFYDDDNPFEVNVSVGNTGWAAVTRCASSEATVSEEDHHELARLYLTGNAD
ncbi:hypothetical protein PENDEC_c004G06826 [Penicillium decumbens]|uniref:Uncharacterized protein n=1 Tax=Penicillium decumbens TaxID=69771 RepID=A0A1V6PHS5_PENDC|nr:hypothetical protein PENDEC_c004G06826 [Penicillium decumbens]